MDISQVGGDSVAHRGEEEAREDEEENQKDLKADREIRKVSSRNEQTV